MGKLEGAERKWGSRRIRFTLGSGGEGRRENIVVRIPAICICSSKLKADATRVSRVFFPSFFFSSLPLFFLFPSSFPRLDENAFTVSSIGR